jgi:hypothetical protein
MARRPGDLTIAGFAKALPYSWADQERAISRKAWGGGVGADFLLW